MEKVQNSVTLASQLCLLSTDKARSFPGLVTKSPNDSLHRCFRDLIDGILADEDASSKVVNVAADVENDIGESGCNSLVTADSLVTA